MEFREEALNHSRRVLEKSSLRTIRSGGERSESAEKRRKYTKRREGIETASIGEGALIQRGGEGRKRALIREGRTYER